MDIRPEFEPENKNGYFNLFIDFGVSELQFSYMRTI